MLSTRSSRLPVMAIIMGFIAMASAAQGEVNKRQQGDDQVAKVNGEPIVRGEYEGEVMKIQQTLLGYGKPLSSAQVCSVQKEVLEGMIRREILYQESRKAGIKADEEAVKGGRYRHGGLLPKPSGTIQTTNTGAGQPYFYTD